MNCDLFFASAPRLMVAEPGKAASVRFSRCAPYALSGSLARSLPCLRLISSPLNLLPMFPNDCYPCPRPKQRSEMATLKQKRIRRHRVSAIQTSLPIGCVCSLTLRARQQRGTNFSIQLTITQVDLGEFRFDLLLRNAHPRMKHGHQNLQV